jgi:hypothetical protein
MSEYSIYPMAIDGYAQIPLAVDKRSPINAESVNRLRSGIINIEKAIGIAPEFSSEFGSFPDMSHRVSHVESLLTGVDSSVVDFIHSEILSADIVSLVDNITLTDLYLKDGSIELGVDNLSLDMSHGGELSLSTSDGPSANLSLSDSFALTTNDAGINFKPTGAVPTESALGVNSWPKSTSFLRSDEVDLAGGAGSLSSLLSLGGQPAESDLSVFSLDAGISRKISFISGIHAASNASILPAGLEISTLPPLMSDVDSPGIRLRAADTNFLDVAAGGINLKGGRSPFGSHAGISISGAGPAYSGIAEIFGGSSESSFGAYFSVKGGSEHTGGKIRLASGASASGAGLDGGPVEVAAGAGDKGGDVIITSGESYTEDPAVILISATPSSSGESGYVTIQGRALIDGSLSLGITQWQAGSIGDTYVVEDIDYTVLVISDYADAEVILPPSSLNAGRVCRIKWIAGIGSVSTVTSGGGPIDGLASYPLPSLNDVRTFQSDGSQWYVIG